MTAEVPIEGIPISGEVLKPAFAAVSDAFRDNFERRGDLGAAYAVVVDGQEVVNLWGGLADAATHSAWQADTLCTMFSGSKGLVALCVLMLVDRRQLELEAPVCRYWEEFGRNGKRGVTVGDIMAHRARLPGVATPVTVEEIVDARRMSALLGSQAPEVDPRARDVYHALTFGWLCGELVRRVDGRSIGRFFADEVVVPLGLELWIGLPAEHLGRVATAVRAREWAQNARWDAAAFAADELLNRVWNNPSRLPGEELPWNSDAWRCAEIPAGGAIGTARSVARLYGCLASGGALGGVRLLSAETLALGCQGYSDRLDPLLGRRHRFGAGFQLQTDLRVFGPPSDAFGHTGAGGSVHCAWPGMRTGVSYVMNQLRNDRESNARAGALLDATYDALRTYTHERRRA